MLYLYLTIVCVIAAILLTVVAINIWGNMQNSGTSASRILKCVLAGLTAGAAIVGIYCFSSIYDESDYRIEKKAKLQIEKEQFQQKVDAAKSRILKEQWLQSLPDSTRQMILRNERLEEILDHATEEGKVVDLENVVVRSPDGTVEKLW